MYKRDFKVLTKSERAVLDEYNREVVEQKKNGFIQTSSNWKILDKEPGLYYHLSLFPNNRIFPSNLEEIYEDLTPESIVNKFENLIDNKDSIERTVLNFIKSNFAYFIPASIVKDYSNWGHHQLYLFPEFQLGTNYRVDYLIVGKNSDGFHFKFVEFEGIYGRVSTKGGKFGSMITKGINQINDWKIWLQQNYYSLKRVYEKYLSKDKQLPDEFFELDLSRITFGLVCGRRTDFNERTYRDRRELLENRIVLFHYDNLVDSSKSLITSKSIAGENRLINLL